MRPRSPGSSAGEYRPARCHRAAALTGSGQLTSPTHHDWRDFRADHPIDAPYAQLGDRKHVTLASRRDTRRDTSSGQADRTPTEPHDPDRLSTVSALMGGIDDRTVLGC